MQLAAEPTAFVGIRQQNADRATVHPTVMPKLSAASTVRLDLKLVPSECVARSSGTKSIRMLERYV
jgi:hypothetical protein